MKLLAALAFSAFAFCGPLRADPIWSYAFTEQYLAGGPQLGFVIWHDGPVIPIGDMYLETVNELHSCVRSLNSGCSTAQNIFP